jgi:hypothetical protein
MAENGTDKTERSGNADFVPSELAAMGRKRLDQIVGAQTQQLEKFGEMSRNWLDRMQSEAALASELATRLAAARSAPEVATAYQEWGTRHIERAAEDARRIFAEARKLAESGAQLLSRGLRIDGESKSS